MNQSNFPVVNEPIKVITEEDFSAKIQIGERFIDFSINFEEEEDIDKEEVLQVQKKVLYNLPSILTKVHRAISDSYENGGEAKEYFEMHLDLLEEEDLLPLLKNTDAQKNQIDRLYSTLHLDSIWVELEEIDDLEFVFDFTIGRSVVDYVIGVSVTTDGEVTDIRLES